MAGPARRRPQFDYLERFKDEMQQILEQLSWKESAAQLQKELIEEHTKKMQKFIKNRKKFRPSIPKSSTN